MKRSRAVADALESRVLLSSVHGATVAQPASIGLSTTAWTPIGPAPIAGGPMAGGGAVTGRINAVAADPTDSNVIYVGAAGGGVWKTVNGGTTWTPLTDTQTTLNTGAIAIAPSNASVIYVGTGDGTGSTQSFYGRGVLKSIDAGATWALLGSAVFNRHNIARVIVDPANANTVYAAVPGGGTNGQGGSTGVWKSTDGGTTWANTTSSIDANGRWDVAMDPSNSQRFIATLTGSAAKNGIYVSTNAGGSWTLVAGAGPAAGAANNARVAFAPSNALVLYGSFADTTNHVLGIWKSADGGATWSQLPNVPDYLAGGGIYDNSLAVNPTDANVVYAGGSSQILQSRDGGQTWADVTVGAGGTNGTGIEHEAEAFDAAGRMLDANGNGIFRLDNASPGAISWSDLNGNLNVTQFLSAAVDPTTPDKVFAAGQDNGVATYSGSLSWTKPDAGVDGGVVRISAQNPSRIYRQVPNTSTAAGNFIRRSDDGGVTWAAVTNGIAAVEPQVYYAPLAIDPNNGNHLLYGTSRVYETTDGGDHWTPISTPFLNGWTLGVAGTVVQLAFAPSDPHTIYAVASGVTFVTTNDGASWTARNTGNSPVTQIVVDPQNAQIAYATGGSFGTNKVVRTSDGGATWQNLTGNLPDLPTYTVALNGATLYAGNDNGVFASGDDGTTWARMGAALPNVQVRELRFDAGQNILAAATFGRGVWEISTAVPVAPLVVNTLADETTAGDGLLSLREAVAASNLTGETIGFATSLAGGTIVLDPANGPLVISRSMSISGPAAAPIAVSAATADLVEVSGGASVQMSWLSLGGSGTVLQIDAGGQLTLLNATVGAGVTDNGALTFYTANGDVTASASVTGSGSVLKSGAYTLTLTGTNGYTGGTTVRTGILKGSTNALQRNISVTAGAQLAFDQSALAGADGSFGGKVSGSGAVRVTGPGSTVRLGTFAGGTASTLGNSGATNIDAGATLVAGTTNSLGVGSAFTVDGNLDLGGFGQQVTSLAGAATGAVYNKSAQANPLATLMIGGATSTTYLGVLEDVPAGSGSAGKLALNKTSTGTLTLGGNAADTYTGGTANTGGAIIGNSRTVRGAFSGSAALTIDQSLGGVNDGTLDVTLSGTAAFNVLTGIVRLGSGATLANSGITTIAGTLIGPTSSGANAFSALSAYVVNGVLDLGGFDQTVGALSGSGSIYNGRPGLATLTVATGTAVTTYVGKLMDHPAGGTGTLAVKKIGTGTLTLEGANTYSGGTSVVGGTLAAGPSEGDPLGSGAAELASGDPLAAVNLYLQGRMTSPAQQPIAVSGFNRDVIVEASAANPLVATSGSIDLSDIPSNNVWYEQGFGGASAQGTGMPPDGTTFTSLSNAGVSFQLQPYRDNNVAFMQAVNSSVTLQLGSPGSFSSLNFLAAAANGNAVVTATFNYGDGSTIVRSLAVPDWFNGANPAFIAGGRVFRTTGTAVTLAGPNPRLYEFDFTLTPAEQVKVLNSITFKETSGGTSGVYAISGSRWSLLANQPYANALRVLSHATIGVSNSPATSMGDLTVNDGGNDLPVIGPSGVNTSISFASVNLQSDALLDPAAGVTMTLGPVTDGGGGFAVLHVSPGTLEFAGANSYGGRTVVSAGTLLVDTALGLPAQTDVTVQGRGLLQLRPGVPFTAQIHRLILTEVGSRFDLGNNTLWIHFGTTGADDYARAKQYIADGYNAGNWNGTGSGTSGAIISSSAAADPFKITGIAYTLINDDLADGTPGNTVLLTYDLYGDSNFDRNVSSNDQDVVNLHLDVGSDWGWAAGDFTYDGLVTTADQQAQNANLGTGMGLGYPMYDTVTGTAGADGVTLWQELDHQHVAWQNGTTFGQLLVGDPNGLMVSGLGGSDVITLDYSNGNSLPDVLHLNGVFSIYGLSGTNPLAGKTLDMGRSTVYIAYADAASDPIAAIKAYLAGGYNGGGWTGAPAGGGGVITSLDARNDPLQVTGIGYVDFGDGTGLNTVPNTVLLKYAVIGDTDLDGTVGLSDYTAVVRNFGIGTNWTQGAVTYGPTVNLSDYTAVVRNFGKSVPAPAAVPAGVGSVGAGSNPGVPAASIPGSVSVTPASAGVWAVENDPHHRNARSHAVKRR